MKLVARFFGSSSSKKESKRKIGKNGGANKQSASSSSFGSTTSTASSSPVPTPRTVLLPSPSETNKPPPLPAVTRNELEAALRKVASSEAELAEMLADDEAGSAVVALLMEEGMMAADEGELREAFAAFDADGDGRISAEELRHALGGDDRRCSVEDCRRMIRRVDADGDGFVCFREFATMMTTTKN